jgi:predicted ABC-type ATPase
MPEAVLIGGAGKTTFARRLLPLAYPRAHFLNADEIQRENSDFATPLAAGRELLARLAKVVSIGDSFVVETTLSSSAYTRRFSTWRGLGYRITLHFLQVSSAEVAVQRVAARVAAGGHGIAEVDIRRRYGRGLRLFSEVYRLSADACYVYEVDEQGAQLVENIRSTRS